MTLCKECQILVTKLHPRSVRQGHIHKNLIDLLNSALECELCNLVVSAPFVCTPGGREARPTIMLKGEDVITPIPETFKPLSNTVERPEERVLSLPCLNALNRTGLLEYFMEEFESSPEDFEPFQVSAIEDIETRLSQITFHGSALSGFVRGYVSLAIWRESPCVTNDADCPRHNPSEEAKERLRQSGAERAIFRLLSCVHSDVAFRSHGLSFVDQTATELELLSSWIHKCETTHPECSFNIQGDEVLDTEIHYSQGLNAPSRLLQVEGDTVKLWERLPAGFTVNDFDQFDEKDILQLQHPYVALSHCWGPDTYHPPKTTRANLERHTQGIPLSELPPTFRDAIQVVLYLGMDLLWIDSLCIIQDDEDDWKRESARMDEIYQNARFTIAAADAPHSQAGLFVAERPNLQDLYERSNSADHPLRCKPPESSQLAIPTVGTNGLPVTINFAPVTAETENPYYSRLGHRSWAVQEWYLSRRVVFFTRGGLAWKCRNIQFGERGRYFDMHEKPEWEHLLQRYSETHLTRETDRLIAIQGIVNASITQMSGSYHFGVWTHMPDLLLWTASGTQHNAQGVNAPSWSWASRNGSKFFFKTLIQYGLDDKRQDLLEYDISIDEAGTLVMETPILQVKASVLPRDPETWNALEAQYFHWGPDFFPEAALFHLCYMANLPCLYVQLPGAGNDFIGVSSCDEDLAQGYKMPMYCVFLASTHRAMIGRTPEYHEDGVNYVGNDGKRMLWFLLVTPVEGRANHYRRLGMGVIGSIEQVGEVTYQKIAIV